MKLKNLLFGLALVLVSISFSKAQPDNLTSAPNFTLTDLNGKSHDMYSYLNQDVHVILFLWASQGCNSCISALNPLKQIWNSKGFSATGDSSVMILALEINPSTSNEASVVASQNIPFPVFDNGHTIDNLKYNTGSVPTFYVVCPDRIWSIKKGGIMNANTLLNDIASCQPVTTFPLDLRTNFNWYNGDETFCLGHGIKPRMWIKNMGTTTVTSFDVEIGLGGTILGTTSWTGSLARFESANIQFDEIGAFTTTAIVDLAIVRPNGSVDAVPLDNSFQVQARKVTTYDSLTFTLFLNTDGNASETSWELVDHRNVIIAEGGKAAPLPNNTPLSEVIKVPGGGCYELIFYDSGNNGWGSSGNMLLQPAGTGGVVASLAGNFGSEAKTKFEVKGVYTDIGEDQLMHDFKVYPNPFTNQTRISFDLPQRQDLKLQLLDMSGKQLSNQNLGNLSAGYHEVDFHVGAIPAGMYFLMLQAEGKQIVQKITIQ